MEPSAAAPNTVRFGVFEADLASGELRKRGRKVPLQDQPFQVLALLLRHRGEVVSREELQRALWPADTFVEFEQGLNTAINKLRQALGDSADSPRFIETVPRRGYRFIAPVEGLTAPAPILFPALIPVPAPEHPKRTPWRWILGLTAIVTLVVVTGLWPPPPPVVRVTQLISDARRKGPWLAVSGDRLIYSALELGREALRWDLWSVPAAGGEARREPTPYAQMGGGALLQGVSYLRQRLFLQCRTAFGEADLWLTGFDGSNAKSIGHFKDVYLGTVFISPSLEMLVFSRKEGLFARPVDGGTERQLVRPEVWNFLFDSFWHPGGDRIGFLRKVDGLLKAWEVRADGTGLRPLVPEFAGEQYDAQWSADGQRLYFVSQGDIYLQRGRGWLGWMRRPAPARLTAGSTWFYLPTEDPANPLVIYSQGYVSQAAAMKLDRKTNAWEPFLGGKAADRWSFSPDGQWIAYLSWSRRELRKCRRDGSGEVLLEDRLLCAGPRWSPDGSRIAFSGLVRPRGRFDGDASKPFHLYTISSNGGKPDPVPGATGLAYDPTWSPDSKRLVMLPFAARSPRSSSTSRSSTWRPAWCRPCRVQTTFSRCAGRRTVNGWWR